MRFIKANAHVRRSTEEGRKLHRQWHARLRFNCRTGLDVVLLHFRTADGRVGDDSINIQLDRVGTCFFHHFAVLQPSTF